ncbi:MAG: NAD(P)/FAD-dependent oxidoreductase [Pseudoclavibacter sp.]|nr:NAD(P)/FAD-dependent oxidoreductase [Pseudoclavibacter sp.]
MRSSEFVLVGSGMAALVAAARLLEHGHRVLVLERTDRPGGYFGGFRNEAGDRFDLAVSHLLGAGPGGPFRKVLELLGLGGRIELRPVELADVVTLRGHRIELPSGLDRLQRSLSAQFPGSAGQLERFIGFLREFLGEGDDERERGRFLLRNRLRGFQEFCTETIDDPLLRNALAMRIQCDDSALLIMAGFLAECYGRGMTVPIGGVHALVEAMAGGIRRAGGRIRYGCEVRELRVEGDRATGVVLADGTVHPADVVLFNGDGPALRRQLRERGLPEPEQRGRCGHSSLSVFHTLAGAELSRFGAAARHYLSETEDVFESYRVLERGRTPEHPVIKLHLPSRLDRTLAAPGRELVRIEVDTYHDPAVHTPAFYRDYARRIERTLARSLLPELATHSVYRRVLTPCDFQARFGHTGGSATGWAHDVDNYMRRRMSQRTSLGNVLITGQWGEHGSGLPQLIASAERSVALAEHWLRGRERG